MVLKHPAPQIHLGNAAPQVDPENSAIAILGDAEIEVAEQ